MVRAQMELILDVQTDEWWQDVTVPMLEVLRQRLRDLIKLIEKQQRKPIYTDFEDQMGGELAVDLPGFAASDTFERFRAKARAFLKEHEQGAESVGAWADLCHVLFNVKEFVFVP